MHKTKEIERSLAGLACTLMKNLIDNKLAVDEFVILFTYPRNILNHYYGRNDFIEYYNNVSNSKLYVQYFPIISDLFGDNDAYYTILKINNSQYVEITEENLRVLVSEALSKLEKKYILM